MSYIEKEKAVENVSQIRLEVVGARAVGKTIFTEALRTYRDAVLKSLNEAPTADVVEVVHAYWKETNHITESKRGREIHSKLYDCSNCDAPNGRKKSSYCHWCGAKMDGERSRK